jgi:hypothetical protein
VATQGFNSSHDKAKSNERRRRKRESPALLEDDVGIYEVPVDELLQVSPQEGRLVTQDVGGERHAQAKSEYRQAYDRSDHEREKAAHFGARASQVDADDQPDGRRDCGDTD